MVGNMVFRLPRSLNLFLTAEFRPGSTAGMILLQAQRWPLDMDML